MDKNNIEIARQTAAEIVRGRAATPREVLELEKVLRGGRQFGLARRILERIEDDPELARDRKLRLTVAQKLAVCTYEDPDLPADQKLDDALRILRSADDLDTTKDQATLGIAGAIYKRKWERSAQERQLETSFLYYYGGYGHGVEGDHGYTGINAAFVLDLLADLESVDATAGERRKLARSIRQDIVARLPALASQPNHEWLTRTWWFLVTLGEAYFGLDECDNARAWLMKAAALPDVPDWEQESSARQLATLLQVKRNLQRRGGPALQECLPRVLHEFLGANAAAVESVVRGKVGLALSGGGFRASFYHIGVLAKLAELDLLRHVEYLSCVSGGSIVGAHFYLEVRKLLEEKADARIEREDYIDLVGRIAQDFFDGVRTNIRTQIAAEWLTNLKMIFLKGYSRTMRAGELYEREIYARVDDGAGKGPRWLNDLKVQPKGDPGFSPKDNNWRRAAKVPILVLNATTLNTGHNWQFTATWMGEPPADIDTEIDSNYRLRRMYYSEAPEAYRRVRLGYAVAASACVPGIFEPLGLWNLYQRTPPGEKPVRPVVRLVDGGVYDNQGVSALLEQGCSVLLVSDASGQMDARDFPSSGLLGVPLRANSILQSRVRVSEFGELSSRRRGGLLKGLMFVHLKKGLEVTPVDWVDCQDPSKPQAPRPLTEYGVQQHIQRQLAAVRTDLDSFSEVEAYALMTSGYLMVEDSLKDPVLGFDVARKPRERWKFLEIEPFMKEPSADAPLVRQLAVANSLFFKAWLLMRQLQILGGLLALALACLLGYVAYASWEGTLLTVTVKGAFLYAGTTVLSLLGLGALAKILDYRKAVTDVLIGFGMATFGFLLARLHLHVFDKLFLWQGRLDRLARKAGPVSTRPAGSVR